MHQEPSPILLPTPADIFLQQSVKGQTYKQIGLVGTCYSNYYSLKLMILFKCTNIAGCGGFLDVSYLLSSWVKSIFVDDVVQVLKMRA